MTFYSNKTVLITGATGLIGSNLVEDLMKCDNIKLIALSRSENKLEELFKKYENCENFSYIVQDIKEPLQISEKIDVIYHAAGSISGEIIKNNPVDIIMTNIVGTQNCLEFLRKQKEQEHYNGRIILFSSATVYGNLENKDITVSEDDTQVTDKLSSPIAPYSQSKRMTETIATSYYKQYGIDVVIARFSYVYGYCKYYPNTALYSFINKALNNEDIVLNGTKFARRDNIYVKDVIKYLHVLSEKGISGEAYNISSNGKGDNFAGIDEIAKVIVDIVNNKLSKNIKLIKKEFNERISGIVMQNAKTLAITEFTGGVTPLYDSISEMIDLFVINELKGGAKM